MVDTDIAPLRPDVSLPAITSHLATYNLVAAPVVDWTIAYEDGPASVDQACFGTTRADGNVYAAGWAVHRAVMTRAR